MIAGANHLLPSTHHRALSALLLETLDAFLKRFGVPATTRASFYLYTVPEEIDRLCDGLEDVRELFA